MTEAYYLKKYGDSGNAFELKEFQLNALQANEVGIEVHCFGLNFADIMARRNLYPDCPPLPCILGYEVAGVVKEKGSEVTNLNVGDRVIAFTRFGGYSRYVQASKEGVIRIPDQLPMEDATQLATQGCTAYYAAIECINLFEGDKVLIQSAAGGVGTILTQIAASKKCFTYGTASSGKLEFIKSNGIDIPIDYQKVDFYKHIRETKELENGLQVVFDSHGGGYFAKGLNLLEEGGKIVLFGSSSSLRPKGWSIWNSLKMVFGFKLFSPIQLILKSKGIVAVNMLRIADYHPHVIERCLNGVMRMYEEGVINPVLDRVFHHSEIAQAHEYLESRKSIGKVVVSWN